MPTTITRFLKFQTEQGAILPPGLAASYLGISKQALAKLRTGKKIDCQTVAGTAFFGLQSLREYRELITARNAIDRAIKKDVTT